MNGIFDVKFWRRRKSGKLYLFDEDIFHNLITSAGRDHSHKVTLLAEAQIATWYVLLMGATPNFVAADTMAAHAGWTEVVAYTQATRQTWLGVSSGVGTNDNVASPAAFTINVNGTLIGGIALTSSNAKSGVVGTLYSGGIFSGGNRQLNNTEVLTIEYGQSHNDDGIA